MKRSRFLHGIGLVSLLLFLLPIAAPLSLARDTRVNLPAASGRALRLFPVYEDVQHALDQIWTVGLVDAPRDFKNLGERSLVVDEGFHPHIAYAGRQLYYAEYDGSAWQFETVDGNLGATGGVPALALDSAGQPGIAYQASRNLKYAWRVDNTWQIMAVANGGYFPSLALDAAGHPNIAYGTSATGPQLRYAWFDGTNWHVESLGDGGRPSLVLDAAGHPHIAYNDGTLRYAWHDGSTWHIETVDLSASERISLALDITGQPHIVYDADGLHYAWHDGVGWRKETISATGEDASLVLDAAGRPHVGYREGNTLRYAWHDGDTWYFTTAAEGDAYHYISAALDPLENFNLSWLDPAAGLLHHAWYDGTTWWLEPVDRTGDVGRYSSLALDAVSQPYVSYCWYHDYWNPYPSQCDSLEVAYFDGSAWQRETVERGPDTGYDTSLALDGQNHPQVSYRRADALRYATYDGADWQLTTVDAAGIAAGGTSLALDSNLSEGQARPHISYQYNSALLPLCSVDNGTLKQCVSPSAEALTALKHAWHSGNNWYTEIIETSTTGSYRHSALVLDAAGRPHISYGFYSDYGVDFLKYAWYDGTDWQVQAVDSGEGVGGYTSLALDSAGRPHISYLGGNTLRYAWHDGTSWHLQTVDNGGTYTSLTLDAADRPHISYYDWANYRLRYAWHDGAVWHLESPDDDVNVGMDTALALDAAARPYITYYDAVHHDLRIATQCVPLTGVEVTGPTLLPAGGSGLYTAWPLPPDASLPISYAWDNGATGPTAWYSWPTTGTHTITVNAANLCGQAQGTMVVSVTCQPVEAVQLAGPHTVPTGQTATYQAIIEPISPSLPLTITWSNGSVGPTAAYSWTMTGTYTVAVTATNVCGEAQAALTVTAFCQPVEGLQVQGPRQLPLGEVGSYEAFPQPITASLPLTLTWDNGVTGPTAAYSWTMTGTYTVTVTGTNACGSAQESFSVTVFCQPVEGVVVDGPLTLPVSATGVYTAVVQPISATLPITFTWSTGFSYGSYAAAGKQSSFSSAETAITATAAYSWTTAGTYTLSVTATNACGMGQGNLVVQVIETVPYVRMLPIIPKVYTPPPCEPVHDAIFSRTPLTPTVGQLVTFTASASGTAPISFTWAMGDGVTKTGAIVTHAYAATGTYTVLLTATNDCGQDVATRTLTVVCTPPHDADFAWACSREKGWGSAALPSLSPGQNFGILMPEFCTPTVGQVVAFTASVTGTTPLTYTWRFGDSSWVVGPLAAITHTYAVTGTYMVTLLAANPCGQDVATHTLSVLPAPCEPVHGTDFAWIPLTPTVGQMVTFTASASGTAPISFTWSLGDGVTATGALVTHTYAVTGTYMVLLTATNACGQDFTTHTLAVIPPPCAPVYGADFTWTPVTPTVGQVVTFTASASGTAPISFSWALESGITATGAIVTHTYATTGTYTVTLTVINACGVEVVSHTVMVGMGGRVSLFRSPFTVLRACTGQLLGPTRWPDRARVLRPAEIGWCWPGSGPRPG